MELNSPDAEATFALGRALGAALMPGDFVGLSGPLGAGKTLFARGAAAGAGVPLDEVSSPTYSIIQTYRGSHLALHHADLYRLSTEADLFSTGYFDLVESQGAFLVEWVDRIRGAAPDDALRISFWATSPEVRVLRVQSSGPASQALLARWVAALERPSGSAAAKGV